MTIIVNNNKCRLVGHPRLLSALREHPAFCIRVKGAFFSPAYRRGVWDGKYRFISGTGVFDTGKLPQIISVAAGLIKAQKRKEDIDIEDERPYITPTKIPKQLNGVKVREYQFNAVKAVKKNKIAGIPFHRGLILAATNAGKTLISAMLHETFDSKTIFYINSKELFGDAIKEIPKLLPGKVGILASGYNVEWNDFMIAMVQTVRSRKTEVAQELSNYPVVLVDEADLATSKTYKDVISLTYNSFVRLGLTGSGLVDPRKREKNEKLRAIFGDVIYTIKNRDLIKMGYSSKVHVEIHKGNTHVKSRSFVIEYEEGIIKNIKRNKYIVDIAEKEVKADRLPLLILTKNHAHVRRLFKRIQKRAEIMGHPFFGLKIDWVHHKRKERFSVVKRFEAGTLDILVGSYILKRGKNFPLMRSIIHAGAGDSMENVLQVLGRATRKHSSKDSTMLHDFFDMGQFLKRHSKHRLFTYKGEQLPVKELYQ